MPSESPQQSPFTSYNDNEGATAVPENMSPVADRWAAFLPYRGAMFHGVTPSEVPLVDDGEELPDGAAITDSYESPTEDLNPVPVKIVDTAQHEYKQWRAWQTFVTAAQPAMVANRKEGQSSLQLKNVSDASRIWVGPDPSVSVYTGFPVKGGEEVSFTGEAPVYAIADTGVAGNVVVALLSQFSTAQ